MRKKLSLLAMLLIMALVFTACTKADPSTEPEQETEDPDQNETDTDTDNNGGTGADENGGEENTPITITLYLPSDEGTYFTPQDVTVEEKTAESVMAALSEAGLFNTSIAVNSSTVTPDDNGVIYLDLSNDFQTMVYGLGDSGEYYVIGGVVNTFLQAFEADSIRITVDGNSIDTNGAGELNGNFNWYD